MVISSLHLQIVIDVAFFVTIILILYQIGRKLKEKPPAVDDAMVAELKQIMVESQNQAGRFLQCIEDNKAAMNRLVRQLEAKEKELVLLINEAEKLRTDMEAGKSRSEKASPAERYEETLEMIQQGLSREEAAQRSGLAEGEINLIMELAKARAVKV